MAVAVTDKSVTSYRCWEVPVRTISGTPPTLSSDSALVELLPHFVQLAALDQGRKAAATAVTAAGDDATTAAATATGGGGAGGGAGVDADEDTAMTTTTTTATTTTTSHAEATKALAAVHSNSEAVAFLTSAVGRAVDELGVYGPDRKSVHQAADDAGLVSFRCDVCAPCCIQDH